MRHLCYQSISLCVTCSIDHRSHASIGCLQMVCCYPNHALSLSFSAHPPSIPIDLICQFVQFSLALQSFQFQSARVQLLPFVSLLLPWATFAYSDSFCWYRHNHFVLLRQQVLFFLVLLFSSRLVLYCRIANNIDDKDVLCSPFAVPHSFQWPTKKKRKKYKHTISRRMAHNWTCPIWLFHFKSISIMIKMNCYSVGRGSGNGRTTDTFSSPSSIDSEPHRYFIHPHK